MSSRGKSTLGRPRGFDTDEALQRALLVFWERGYECASLTDLTDAMNITRISMYAAFGNKEELFRKALDRYTAGPASYGLRAMQQETAREVATAFLHGSVEATTGAGQPSGCLGVQGSLAAGDAGAPACAMLVEWRRTAQRHLAERFHRAAAEGDLPSRSDATQLACYIMTIAFGIAVQAATGVDPAELHAVADQALRNWPPVDVVR